MSKKKSLISPLEAELSALREKVARRREYMDLLELELSNTRSALQEFTDVYNRRIGPLESRQQQLQQLLEEMMADQEPPSNDWRGKKYESGARSKNGNGNGAGYSQQDKPFTKRQPSPPPDPDYERKVRDLFRRLAKQYHPDVAQDEDQKKRHEQLMSEINQAYSAKDLEALEQLAKSRGADPAEPAKTPAAELARLQSELRELEMMIFDIERTIRELDLSPAMQMRSELRADQEDGRDSLSELEAELRTRIAVLQEQLLALGADLDISEPGQN
jgi:curved DNA-binding protein CbpA